jgi:hypothetical protein
MQWAAKIGATSASKSRGVAATVCAVMHRAKDMAMIASRVGERLSIRAIVTHPAESSSGRSRHLRMHVEELAAG